MVNERHDRKVSRLKANNNAREDGSSSIICTTGHSFQKRAPWVSGHGRHVQIFGLVIGISLVLDHTPSVFGNAMWMEASLTLVPNMKAR